MTKRTSKTQKASADCLSRSKTSRTSSKKRPSMNGLSAKECLERLNASISIAKGTHAILSSRLTSDSIRKLNASERELRHLQILSQDLMDEIWNAESIVTQMLMDNRPRLIV